MMTGERVGVGHDRDAAPRTSRAGSRRSRRTRARSRRAAADAQRISDFVLVRHIERETVREAQPIAASRAPAPQGPQRIHVPVPPIPTRARGAGPTR